MLHRLGAERAFVVHGHGLDELPLDGTWRHLRRVDGRRAATARSTRWRLGLRVADSDELRGGDAAENAAIIEGVLDGERGPRRDVVLLNAGAALLVSGRVGRLARRR